MKLIDFDGLFDEKLTQLNEAMESMDIDTADEIMKNLRTYEYAEELAQKVEELGIAVVNLDVEAVKSSSEEIRNLL